jgi:signal transduction histidine kinase
MASLSLLERKLEAIPEKEWSATVERTKRNLRRILEIQAQVEDIMRGREYMSFSMLTHMLEQCMEELEALLAEKVGEGEIVQWLRSRLEEEFGLKESKIEKIPLSAFVRERVKALGDKYSHRHIDIVKHLETDASVKMPVDVIEKVVDGLVKNAIENTPDGGRIELFVQESEKGVELVVKDFGVGIMASDCKRIFEGFFATQETIDYSSKRPFDFNAGGKGSDLLRMKVFAERYGFQLNMSSTRCGFLEQEGAICPGSIDQCKNCKSEADCMDSGSTSFFVFFPFGDKAQD